MASHMTSRSLLIWATMAGMVAGSYDVARAQGRRVHAMRSPMMMQARRGQVIRPQAPVEQRPIPQARASQAPAPNAQNRVENARQTTANERRDAPMMSANHRAGGRGGEHLSEWMNQHSNLNPAQQQQALEREPGFHELPMKTQQRLRDQLTQLNNMPPQQRARWVARTEAMERLTPDQRAQVRGAMQQLASLPPEQRGPVQRSFRQLREMPPEQREAALNSERYRGQLNPSQQATLNNLMRIEPMLEPEEPRQPR
jgi:hypothetical protein